MTLRLHTFLTSLLALLMTALLVLAPAVANPASGEYQLSGGVNLKLPTGALDRQYAGDMIAASEAMKHYVNPILAALTSGGDVGQYGTNLGIQSSQLANNYLSHAENTRRINAEQALKACDDSGTCSAEQVAELTETVTYWDQVDAERDAALTAACTADRTGSDCRDLVRDALIAQDRLPGDFILNAGNGYAEAPIRYGEYGAENSGDPRLDAVAARERAHIVEYNSTENVLAPYEDIARSIARDQGLALIIGGGMTLAVPGGAGSKPAGGGTVGTNKLPVPDDLPTNIHIGQQGKHIRGHNNFEEGRSYFNDGIDPAELLSGVHSGKYPVVGTGRRGNPIVEFGRPIGIDGATGQSVTRGQIHYGKNGAHIVPDVRN